MKFLKCETSEKEELAVLDWLDSDVNNQKELDQLDMLFNVAVLHRQDAVKPMLITRPSYNRNLVLSAFAVAASLIMILGGGWIFSSQKMVQLSQELTSVYVPSGQQILLTLHDGSKVWLNSETTLEYPNVFASDTRRVKVDGEAVFEVEHDANKPFVVETFACDVEVLGTKFNVIADSEERYFSTSLINGSVRVVSRLSDGDVYILEPNQCVTLVGDQLLLDDMDNKDDFLWLKGIVSLKEPSFEILMAKLEKTYNVNIHLQRAEIPQIHYRGKVHVSEGVEHALDILSLGGEFKYERASNSNDIYIK